MRIPKFFTCKIYLSKVLTIVVFLFTFWIYIFLLLEIDINQEKQYGYGNSHYFSKRLLQSGNWGAENADFVRASNDVFSLNNHQMAITENAIKDTTYDNFPISRLPKAIIIGVKKCGTRALLEYLRLHPSIRAPGPEPHFFDRYYYLGWDWYRSKMPKSSTNQITIEKTPRYFVKEEVPERIYNMSKTTKLIVVVRDPVVRAISDFTQAVSKHVYGPEVTFKMKALRHNGYINERWSAISTGLYAQHLSSWLKFFGLNSIHFVNGENLIHNPIKELVQVENFLGLNRFINSSMIYFNQTRGFPCIRRSNGNPKCFRRSKGRHHVTVDNTTLDVLYNYFAPHNDLFYKMTGRSFGWDINAKM